MNNKEEGFGINVDLLAGLPESKNAWTIYLGDHYNKGDFNVNQVVKILLERLSIEMKESTDPVESYLEFDKVWRQFAEGADFGDTEYFENNVFRAVPELGDMVRKRRMEESSR